VVYFRLVVDTDAIIDKSTKNGQPHSALQNRFCTWPTL